MTAHAADSRAAAKLEQAGKLRAQAAKEHRRGDALAAQAQKLDAETKGDSGEKMRGGSSDKPVKRLGGGRCVSDGHAVCGISR
jgi:hypothetical protein